MEAPLMRASHLIANVEALSDLGAAEERAVRARCGEVINEIMGSVSVAWLPLELDVELTATVEEVVGPERLRQWGRDAIAKSARGPLLRPILDAARRMGLTPHTALKRVTYGWTLIYRHCGEIRYERVDDTAAKLWLSGAPAIMTGPTYLRGIAGAFDGVIEIARGRAGFAGIESEGGEICFPCTWTR